MRRLHITAEGQTEETFVNRTIRPYLAQFVVFADVRRVLTSRKRGKEFRGGMTSYMKAKNDIERWLQEEKHNTDVAFTTMFDYYALPSDFPGFAEAQRLRDPYQKVTTIEKAFAEEINDRRFIPYIQLHEFETLLFVDPEKFKIEYFDKPEGIKKLQKIAAEFENPELINQGKETAPSKRIIGVFSDYEGNKPAVGSMIANEIGVEALKKGCAHFNEWMSKLEQLG
jgi:hypothetical protein